MIDHLTNSKRKDGNMLRYSFAVIVVILAGCSSGSQGDITPTHTVKPATTITTQPTLTALPSTPTILPETPFVQEPEEPEEVDNNRDYDVRPTLVPSGGTLVLESLGLVIGDAIPTNLEVITEENISELVEIARWGKGTLADIAYSPDGRWFAVGSSLGVYLYDVHDMEKEAININTGSEVNQITFSPDSELMVLGMWRKKMVEVWDVKNGERVIVLEDEYRPQVYDVVKDGNFVFTPDGKYLAVEIYIKHISLWRVKDWQRIRYISGTGISFSPDGKNYAVRLDYIGSVVVRKTSNDERVHRFGGTVTSVEFQPIDGRLLASYYIDGGIDVFNPETFELEFKFGITSPVERDIYRLYCSVIDWGGPHEDISYVRPQAEKFYFSPGGRYVAVLYDTFSGKIPLPRVYRVSDGSLMWIMDKHYHELTFSPDGNTLAGIVKWGEEVDFWNSSDGAPLGGLFGFDAPAKTITVTPDGKFVVIKSFSGYKLRRLENGELWRSYDAAAMAISPTGNLAALGYENGVVEVINWEENTRVKIFEGHGTPITELAFSPNGEILAVGNNECEVRLWRVSDWTLLTEPVKSSDNDLRGVKNLTFSHDGNYLAWEVEGAIILWNMNERNYSIHENIYRPVLIKFSPDNQYIVSGSGYFEVKEGGRFKLVDEYLFGGVFSPDGRLVIQLSWRDSNLSLNIYRYSDWELLYVISRKSTAGILERQFLESHFSNDGKILLIPGYDGTVRLWGVLGD